MGRAQFAIYTRKLRIRSGLSQSQVAQSLKLKSGQLVSNWERGQCYPPLKLLRVLSGIYDVELKELFDRYSASMKDDMWKKVGKSKESKSSSAS